MVMNNMNEILYGTSGSRAYGSQHVIVLPLSFIPMKTNDYQRKEKINNVDPVEKKTAGPNFRVY